MKVIHCIPIDPGAILPELSYFSQKEILRNSIVAVPLRNKQILAVAVSSENVSDVKATLRSNPFGLKKVGRVVASEFITSAFMKTATQTADFFATRTGAVLSTVIPTKIPPLTPPEKQTDIKTEQGVGKIEKGVLQNSDRERFVQYKSILRQYFSKGLSVTVLVPTITDGEKLKSNLAIGIEKYCFFIHSNLGKTQLAESLSHALNSNHPVLFITTGNYLSLMPKDSGLIIVEKESSSAYKTQYRPFIDFRYFAERLAENSGRSIIFGDELITLENYRRLKADELSPISRPRLRAETQAKEQIVDMRAYKPAITGRYTPLSKELLQALSETKAENGHSFLYVARKGLYPNTVCGDCGSILSCKICGGSAVLHKIKEQKIYICHRCGEKRDSHTRCDNCDSWKLVTLGVGADRVAEEIKELLPKTKVFILNRDKAKSRKGAETIIAEFERSPGAILIGTEMALPYLGQNISTGAVVSLDSLFCLPEYKINEKIINIITKIRSAATKIFILQTRHVDSPVIKDGATGNLAAFYEYELPLRKKFGYPPFSTFIKTTIKGNRENITAAADDLKRRLEPQRLHIFPAMTARKGGRFGLHGLLKIEAKTWPIAETVEVLRNLPPSWQVNVEPDSLL